MTKNAIEKQKLSPGKQIRLARSLKFMTQEDLSKETGIGQALISLYEKDIHKPSMKNRRKLSEILGDVNYE